MPRKISPALKEISNVKKETRPTPTRDTSLLSPPGSPDSLTPQNILQLQRTVGNRAVGRLLHLQAASATSAQSILPLQGKFKRYDGLKGVSFTIWLDLETKVRYMLQDTVTAENGKILFYRVVPILKRTATPIAIRAQFPGSMVYERIDKREQTSTIKSKGERDETPDVEEESPTKSTPSSSNLKRRHSDSSSDDSTPKKSVGKKKMPVLKGSKPLLYSLESAKKGLKGEGLRVGKLTSDLTTNVMVVPIAPGEQRSFPVDEGEKPKLGEMVYTPNIVVIKTILMGDTDRPPTQFKNQERHTVAWTLARNGIMNLAGSTVFEVITYFMHALESLKVFLKESDAGEEAVRVFKMVMSRQNDVLVQANSGKVPLTVWQSLIANLIKVYLQVYQLTSVATFKEGKSKGSGEGHAMARLRKDEAAVQSKDEVRDISDISDDAETLIDLISKPEVLGIQEYAFAVHHWIELLQLNFPHLMSTHGDEVVNPLLSKAIASTHREILKKDKVPNYTKIKTIRDLLQHFHYKADTKAVQQGDTDKRQIVRGGLSLPDVTVRGLTTNFTASVALMPLDAPVLVGEKIEREQEKVKTIQVDAYKANQVMIRFIALSNQDRPKTKFKKTQRSHTVAWTLVRHHILSFANKNVPVMLAMLKRTLTRLCDDIHDSKGKKLAENALVTLKKYESETLPLYNWEHLLSWLLARYGVVYQVAESSAYTSPTDGTRPKGHGESGAMRVLRDNNFTLEAEEAWHSPPDKVATQAVKLFDAFVTDDLTKENVLTAYHHWCEALQDTFPLVWEYGSDELVKALKQTLVTDEDETIADLLQPPPPPKKKAPVKKRTTVKKTSISTSTKTKKKQRTKTSKTKK